MKGGETTAIARARPPAVVLTGFDYEGSFLRSRTGTGEPSMPDGLSENLAYLEPSQTVAISNEAKRRIAAGEDVIDLGVGEPDFGTPARASQAGIDAINRGKTHYAPNAGIPELRTAVAVNLSRMSDGRAVNPDNIIITTGAKQAVFNACFALFGPHDKVLIPTPAWVSYPQIVRLSRAEPVAVPGDPEWGLKVSVDDLERRVDKLTKGIILNSPCNPTGSVYRPRRRTARADRRHLWSEQGLRHDRLAHRGCSGADTIVQGNVGDTVAHNQRGIPAVTVGGAGGVYQRSGPGGREKDGNGVPGAAGLSGRAVPLGDAGH